MSVYVCNDRALCRVESKRATLLINGPSSEGHCPNDRCLQLSVCLTAEITPNGGKDGSSGYGLLGGISNCLILEKLMK